MAAFDRSDTNSKVVEVIATKLKIDKSSVQPASTLADLGADSLDIVNLMMKLEEVFGIEIKDEDAEKFINVQDVVDYVHGLRTK